MTFNTFPALLVYSFFAPTLLRIALACVYFSLVYFNLKHKDAVSEINFPGVGHGAWIPLCSAAAYAAIGGMLLLGYYTQVTALVAILANIKVLVLMRNRPAMMPLSPASLLLMSVMLLSLLVTGAGALALDLPL